MQNSNSESSLEVLVGIDVGSAQHRVAVGLSDGTPLDEFDIDHRPDGFELFFKRVTKHSKKFNGCGKRWGQVLQCHISAINGSRFSRCSLVVL